MHGVYDHLHYLLSIAREMATLKEDDRYADQFGKFCEECMTKLSQEASTTLKGFCADIELFSWQQLKGVQTTYLIDSLRSCALLTEDNMHLLKFVTRSCSHSELLKEVEEFEAKLPSLVKTVNTLNPAMKKHREWAMSVLVESSIMISCVFQCRLTVLLTLLLIRGYRT